MKFKVKIYRDDSVTTVEYENVKHCFWTANNSVLTIAQYDENGGHHYIHWPRERLCWYKIERDQAIQSPSMKNTNTHKLEK